MSNYFNDFPPIKDGMIYSFAFSAAMTGAVTMNPAAAITSGVVGALASGVSSLAKPLFEKMGILDKNKEIGKRTAIVLLADFIISGGKTTLRQALIYLVGNAIQVYQRGSAFPPLSNEAFCHLKI